MVVRPHQNSLSSTRWRRGLGRGGAWECIAVSWFEGSSPRPSPRAALRGEGGLTVRVLSRVRIEQRGTPAGQFGFASDEVCVGPGPIAPPEIGLQFLRQPLDHHRRRRPFQLIRSKCHFPLRPARHHQRLDPPRHLPMAPFHPLVLQRLGSRFDFPFLHHLVLHPLLDPRHPDPLPLVRE